MNHFPRIITATATPDLALARSLVLKTESVAAAAKAWSGILISRLQNPRPMTEAARDVATDICLELITEADELRSNAEALRRLLQR